MTPDVKSIENLFRKLNPEYRNRYEIYNDLLADAVTKDTVWLDVGCGVNEHVATYGGRAKIAIGIDKRVHPSRLDAPFLQADLRNIPLPSSFADLISLRMVVEHLERIPDDLSEIGRLLKPGGRLIVLTTNCLSPFVFLPRLLPYSLKEWLIQRVFQVPSEDVFPTYHRFNAPGKIAEGIGNLNLTSLQFLEQVPLLRPWPAILFGGWYTVTKLLGFKNLRSNMLAVFAKETNCESLR